MRQPTASYIFERLTIIDRRIDRHYRLRAFDRQLLVAIARKLDILTGLEAADLALGAKMSKELDELTTEVSEVKTIQASAVALIEGIADRITDAGVDPAKLSALAADLDASSNALAAAVSANTPAVVTPAEPQ